MSAPAPPVAAIVLAAGRGTRFGAAPKLLAPLDGRPLVAHAVAAALGSRARPVIVVTGHCGAEVGAALAGLDVALVHNPGFADGLSTSLRRGFAALPRESGAALVLLGDMPLVTPALIDRLIAAHADAPEAAAVVPVVGGRRGNPVLLARRLAPEVDGLRGDEGAGRMLKTRGDVVEVAADDEAAALDVDTPAVLASLVRG